jgi:hypothetical protein
MRVKPVGAVISVGIPCSVPANVQFVFSSIGSLSLRLPITSDEVRTISLSRRLHASTSPHQLTRVSSQKRLSQPYKQHTEGARFSVLKPQMACGKLASMSLTDSQTEHVSEVEAALLDAELFMKYQAVDRAIKRLRAALELNNRSIKLRERLREICASQKQVEEAARQCLALASLYIEREDFDTAHDRLLEAKQLDNRINIGSGLEAIRRARRPDLKPVPAPEPQFERKHFTLAGDLGSVSVFDAIQVIENARLNGVLTMNGEKHNGQVMFNDGRIVDAACDGQSGEKGFERLVEITNGTFEFQKTSDQYPTRIQALSNTNLILDTLRLLDEKKQ